MKILILGYSSLSKRKIIPTLINKLGKIKFSICSKSHKKQNIGETKWFRSYDDALKNSKCNIVYISLVNSKHYYWAKKFLKKDYHVIIDKPATLNFKQAKDLVKLARRKKKLLSEAVVFNYHNQIKESIKKIKSLKNLIHVEANFSIPKLKKNNFRYFKKFGGGCLLDMGPYAAAVYRIFINQDYKKIILQKSLTNNKQGLNISFSVSTISNTKSFMGRFSFNEKYENNITLFSRQKSVMINRVFSPPNDQNLTLQINNGHVKKEIRLKKDDVFLNYFKIIVNLIKNKKFENSYQNILKDSFFRDRLTR